MGVRRIATWGVVLACNLVTAVAWAQPATGYGQTADPRAASKGAGPPPPAQPSYGQTPTGSPPPRYQQPGYQQPRPVYPPARPAPGDPRLRQQAPRATAPRLPPPPVRVQGQSHVLAPPVLPYREGLEPPPGYVLESHRNHGLMLGGGLIWGAGFATGLIYAAGKGFDNGTGWLAAPVIGPWGAIAGREFKCESSADVTQKEVDACVSGALDEVTSITFLAMMGLVQAVGATLFFVGAGDQTQQWVRADLADVELRADAGQVGESGYGFTISAHF